MPVSYVSVAKFQHVLILNYDPTANKVPPYTKLDKIYTDPEYIPQRL